MSIEWPPAAATSSARRAAPWPRTSARSGPGPRRRRPRAAPPRRAATATLGAPLQQIDGRAQGGRAEHLDPRAPAPPRRRCRAGRPGAASRARAACSAIASAPGHRPQGPVEGELARPRRRPRAPPAASCPEAARIASASGRSYWGPALRRSAGARLATIRRAGTANAWLASPERTRSRASWTAASGSPTTENAGRPARRLTSTSTVEVSRPRTAGLTSLGDHGARLAPDGARIRAGACRNRAVVPWRRATPTP